MLPRVGVLHCSEDELASIEREFRDSAQLVVAETDVWPRFDAAIVGSFAAERSAVLAAIREKLAGIPIIAITDRDLSDGIVCVSPADLSHIAYIVRCELRVHAKEVLIAGSERRYQEMVENANEGFWAIDRDGNTTFANRKMAALLGTTPRELIGISALECVDEEWRAAAEASLQRRKEGIAETHDLRFRRRDGTTFYATLSSKPLYDESGAYAGASALVIDITARREVEEELQRRETELSIAHELARLGSWEWDLATNRLYGSRELSRLLGVGDQAGTLAAEEWMKLIEPEDLEPLLQAAREAANDKCDLDHEYRVRGAEPMILQSRGRVFSDSAGVPRRIIGMSQDITKAATDADRLRRSEERYRALVEQATDIIFSLDAQQRIKSLNHAFEAVTGFRCEDWIGRPLVEALAHPSHRAAREQFSANARADTVDYELRTSSGATVTIETTSKAIFASDGSFAGVVGIARNVTRRKEVERQLEQEKRLSSLGQLAASVAHEFNNVLMSIMPFAELLKRRMPDDERTATAAHHIFTAIRRGRQVSQEILRFTRPVSLAVTPIDVAEWQRQFAQQAKELLGARYELVSPRSNEPLWIAADRAALDRVATNILLNARDAMPSGGKVTIAARRSETETACIAISIGDQGPGIESHVMTRIFDPLFTTKKGSMGLGLSVAHAEVTRMNGSMSVGSGEGGGSEFTILFREIDPPNGAQPANEKSSSSPRRILLIEDDDAIGEGVRALLIEEGFAVRLASRGADAKRAVIEFNPDVVVLDVNLPDVSGLEVLEQLRAMRPSLPVIISSGHADAKALDAIRNLHVPALMKPYEIGDLLALLARIETPGE